MTTNRHSQNNSVRPTRAEANRKGDLLAQTVLTEVVNQAIQQRFSGSIGVRIIVNDGRLGTVHKVLDLHQN